MPVLRLIVRPAHSSGFRRGFEAVAGIADRGGISVGDCDYVRTVLGELGVRECSGAWPSSRVCPRTRRVGSKAPSRKRSRGSGHRSCLEFGLPGNPVSALVCFHQLSGRLVRMMGMSWSSRCCLGTDGRGSPKEPGASNGWRPNEHPRRQAVVEPTRGQDSHMIGGWHGQLPDRLNQNDSLLLDGNVMVEPWTWRE